LKGVGGLKLLSLISKKMGESSEIPPEPTHWQKRLTLVTSGAFIRKWSSLIVSGLTLVLSFLQVEKILAESMGRSSCVSNRFSKKVER